MGWIDILKSKLYFTPIEFKFSVVRMAAFKAAPYKQEKNLYIIFFDKNLNVVFYVDIFLP